MDVQRLIDTDTLHHAYLVEDPSGEAFRALHTLLRERNPDAELHVREYDVWGIDDSRELLRLARMRSLGTQLFVYRMQLCTREAQNALLKLFEEPPPQTHFFVCVPTVARVVPTLRSRVWVVTDDGSVSPAKRGRDFLALSLAERIALLTPIVKERDMQAAKVLLNEIESALATYDAVRDTRALRHLYDVRRALDDSGASLKILLESVALTVPYVSHTVQQPDV